jgi:TonB family protein
LTAAAPTQPAGGTLPNPEVDSEPATEQVEAPSPEEIDRRVQELLSQRSADMETSMRREFESELAELRQQLVEAQERATAAEELQTATEEPVDPLSDEDAETLRMASTTSFEDADTAAAFPAVPSTEAEAFGDEGLADGNPEDAVDTAPSIEERTGVETTDLLDSQPEAAEAAQGSPEPLQTFSAPVREPVAEVTKPEPEPEPAAVEPVEESVPPTTVDPTPEVQVGDLVAPGPGVTAPRITSPARPVYPILARRLKKSAVVTVKVLVDETGRVTEAERLGDEAGYGFDNAAVEAALATRFEPATKGGVPVKIWWTVRIAFQP